MTRALYKPLSLAVSVVGGILAGAVFTQVWKLLLGQEDAPKPRQSQYSWRQVLPAAAVQGAVFGLVKAAVDRGGARGFQKLTGVWPGD